MKTADKFLPFEEHEKIANQNGTWRMRGVVCMGLAEMNRYIDFVIKEQMETIRGEIKKKEIPITAESQAKHVAFVQSVKELHSR